MRPYEDTVAVYKPGSCYSRQKSTPMTPWSWISRLPEWWENQCLLFKPPCDILLFKPKQTSTMREKIIYIKLIVWKWSQQKIWHDIEQLMEYKKRLSIWPWHWKRFLQTSQLIDIGLCFTLHVFSNTLCSAENSISFIIIFYLFITVFQFSWVNL